MPQWNYAQISVTVDKTSIAGARALHCYDLKRALLQYYYITADKDILTTHSSTV